MWPVKLRWPEMAFTVVANAGVFAGTFAVFEDEERIGLVAQVNGVWTTFGYQCEEDAEAVYGGKRTHHATQEAAVEELTGCLHEYGYFDRDPDGDAEATWWCSACGEADRNR